MRIADEDDLRKFAICSVFVAKNPVKVELSRYGFVQTKYSPRNRVTWGRDGERSCIIIRPLIHHLCTRVVGECLWLPEEAENLIEFVVN